MLSMALGSAQHAVHKAFVFVRILGWDPARRIARFLGRRCTLCDSNTAVRLMDASREWQFWCLQCALPLLLQDDAARPHIHAKAASSRLALHSGSSLMISSVGSMHAASPVTDGLVNPSEHSFESVSTPDSNPTNAD